MQPLGMRQDLEKQTTEPYIGYSFVLDSISTESLYKAKYRK